MSAVGSLGYCGPEGSGAEGTSNALRLGVRLRAGRQVGSLCLGVGNGAGTEKSGEWIMKALLLALLVAGSSSALFAEEAKIGNSLYLKPAFAPLMVAAAEVGSSADPSGSFDQGYAEGQMAAESRSTVVNWGIGAACGLAAGLVGFSIARESDTDIDRVVGRAVSGQEQRNTRPAWSLVSGLIGTGILFGFTSGDAPAWESVSGTGRGSEYQAGFTAGYKDVSKKKKRMARLLGGLGAAVLSAVSAL